MGVYAITVSRLYSTLHGGTAHRFALTIAVRPGRKPRVGPSTPIQVVVSWTRTTASDTRTPTDPNIVLLASDQNGLWRTTNGGSTGHRSRPFPQRIESVGSPGGPRRCIWYGRDESGVYKSTDNGATWAIVEARRRASGTARLEAGLLRHWLRRACAPGAPSRSGGRRSCMADCTPPGQQDAQPGGLN